MTNETTRIAFIGGGHMARSFLSGLIKGGWSPSGLAVADPAAAQRAALAKLGGLDIGSDNAAAVRGADLVVIAVKPPVVPEALSSARSVLVAECPILLSIAAGVRIATIESTVGAALPIVRAMPNLPALIGCGVSAFYANSRVQATGRQLTRRALSAVGHVVEVEDETLLDPVTAVSGSGPAYFFLFVEALEAAAIAEGLPKSVARELVLATGRGALALLGQGQEEAADFRKRVTSPGGTTAAALEVFDSADLRGIVAEAVARATARSHELGDQGSTDDH